jgi:hypothetical protein
MAVTWGLVAAPPAGAAPVGPDGSSVGAPRVSYDAPPATAPAVPAVNLADLPGGQVCQGYEGCDAAGDNSHGYGNNQYTSWWNMSSGDECTNYVAYVESVVYGVRIQYDLGNADEWPYAASAAGVVVNQTPSVGAVAEWDGDAPGIGPLGHVAVVERVGPHDSWIIVSQQHLLDDADGYEWTRINPSYPGDEWEAWPSNFIHFVGYGSTLPVIRQQTLALALRSSGLTPAAAGLGPTPGPLVGSAIATGLEQYLLLPAAGQTGGPEQVVSVRGALQSAHALVSAAP